MENTEEDLTTVYMLGYHDGKKKALAANRHCSDSSGSVPSDTEMLNWLLYTGAGIMFMVDSGANISRTQIAAEMEAQNAERDNGEPKRIH